MNQPVGVSLFEWLRSLPASLRAAVLTELLRTHIAQKLSLEKSDIQARAPLMSLGMSSLQSVEVKMYLERELGAQLSTSLVFDYPTLEALVPELLRRTGLGSEEPAPAVLGNEQSIAEQLAAELADLRRQGAS